MAMGEVGGSSRKRLAAKWSVTTLPDRPYPKGWGV